jgi:penicillin-insensitive murein endopeptidase
MQAATYGGASAASALTAAPAAAPVASSDDVLPDLGPVPEDKPTVQ